MQENWVQPHVGRDPYIESLKNNFDKGYHIGPTGRLVNSNNADAGDYIDAYLKALKQVSIYDYPGGAVKAVFYPGDIVGKVFSYKLYNGQIWWQLDDPSGKHFGWVRHSEGYFEPQGGWGAEDDAFRLQQEQAERENNPLSAVGDVIDGVKAMGTGIGDTLKSFGGNLNTIIIGLIIAVAVYTFFYAKKSLAI